MFTRTDTEREECHMKKQLMKQLAVLSAAAVSAVSMPVISADAEKLDIEKLFAEYDMHLSRGKELHMLDPSGWFSSEITKSPKADVSDPLEHAVILYSEQMKADELWYSVCEGYLSSEVWISFVYHSWEADYTAKLCDFDALIREFAATDPAYACDIPDRAMSPEGGIRIRDYAMRPDFADRVMEELNQFLEEKPEYAAAISRVEYCPLRFEALNLYLTRGFHFTGLSDEQWDDLKARIERENLPWRIRSMGTVEPHDALVADTSEDLADLLKTVVMEYGGRIEPGYRGTTSPLYGAGVKQPQMLYSKTYGGDADGDGSVTLKDALAVMRHYNQTVLLGEAGSLTAEQVRQADTDGDGIITATDAQYIQVYVNWNDLLDEPKTWGEIYYILHYSILDTTVPSDETGTAEQRTEAVIDTSCIDPFFETSTDQTTNTAAESLTECTYAYTGFEEYTNLCTT